MGIKHVLESAFDDLQIAVEKFKSVLPEHEQIALGDAWHTYRLGKDGRDIDKQDYWQYIPGISTFMVDGKEVTEDNRETYKDSFKHNVDQLLKFANRT